MKTICILTSEQTEELKAIQNKINYYVRTALEALDNANEDLVRSKLNYIKLLTGEMEDVLVDDE